MLNIEGALILRAPFNRPNLFYSVLRKPDSLNDCADLLSEWMKTRFLNQTGIIYTTTIKDCESLATELKNRNIKVGVYHAVLDENVRNRMYERWISGSIQVIVATIAFGLGIDKPGTQCLFLKSSIIFYPRRCAVCDSPRLVKIDGEFLSREWSCRTRWQIR